ncbi:hypothetical protein COLO4_20221 [Corchorus olitorius]|uniref:Uncharacterized protein n=1 Tax=Corchorus olitorius TaxID=93759 RepID=A0A1R3J126_9ROSI|nr:hypothetical protein COLO4_20221 [Corchorus olitorius]
MEEKKFPGQPEGQNGEKTSDEKKLSGKSEGHSGEKIIQKEKGRDKDRSGFSGDKKHAGQFSGYNGEKISQNSHLSEDFRDAKFVQELGRRVRDEGAGTGTQLADKFIGTDRKRDEGMVRLVAKNANVLAEEKEKNKRSDDRKLDAQGTREEKRDEGMVRLVAKNANEEKEKNKRSDDRKLDAQGTREETRSGGNAMVPNLSGAVKARVEGMPRQVEKDSERRVEGKEKTKEKESDDKIRDKRKDKDREKKSHGKDKDRDKEKKKEEKEKAKAKGEHRNLEQDNLKGSNKDDHVGTINLKTSHPSMEGNKGAVAEENLRKRKDLEKNGFFHVNDIKPNKLPKTTSSSHPLMNNGRTLESCPAPILHTSDSLSAGSSLKVDNKERKVNGIIEAQPLSDSPSKASSASAQASKMDEVCMKPPHPDSKYLSQILSVPKMEEWSDFDDQEWLFHSNESQSKKPRVGSSEVDEAPQVWAEALQIESADICALPYVIPY